MVQNENPIGILDGGESMRDHERGSIPLQLFDRVLNQFLGFGINAGCGLVQYEYFRAMRKGACERQQLALSGGEVVAPLPNIFFIAAA